MYVRVQYLLFVNFDKSVVENKNKINYRVAVILINIFIQICIRKQTNADVSKQKHINFFHRNTNKNYSFNHLMK